MQINRASQRKLEELKGVHEGAGSIRFASVRENAAFETPWYFIHTAMLEPGSGIGHHRHDTCEEVFVTLDNESQFTHNGRTTQIVGGAAVPLRCGESHAIYNHTDRPTRFFNFNVLAVEGGPDSTDFGDDRVGAALESVDRLPIGKFDRRVLTFETIHSGRGKVGHREVWGPRDFRSNLAFLVHCLLRPDTSIGYHRHDGLEECYVIMNGQGRVTVDDETADVQSGDVIFNPMGAAHGIYNPTGDDLELFIVGVCMEKGRIVAADLNDDLSTR
jgi:mannose-6-phosphate isomerase-like protein (cupin superfamily)